VWVHYKWNGVSFLALGFVALAALRHITGVKHGELNPQTEGESSKAFSEA
jgi:hypothetical protein